MPPDSAAVPHLSPLRRTYLIDRPFQVKYSLLLGAAGAVLSLVFGALTFLLHLDALATWELALESTVGRIPPEFALQRDQSTFTLGVLTVAMAALMGGALALAGVLLTHRVAGPIWVMRRYLAALAEGRYPQMRPLRHSDELHGFFAQLTAAVTALKQREQDEVDELERVLGPLAEREFSPEVSLVVERLTALRDKKRQAIEAPGARHERSSVS